MQKLFLWNSKKKFLCSRFSICRTYICRILIDFNMNLISKYGQNVEIMHLSEELSGKYGLFKYSNSRPIQIHTKNNMCLKC